jgi:hypothetical protein
MNERKPAPCIPVQLAIVTSICVLLSCCLWPIVRDSRGPAGDPIPRRPPDEANRLRHPAGFSMVVPPNWGSHVDGSLLIAPLTPGRYARRSKALIAVSCLGRDEPPDLESMQRTLFLGREAYEEMRVVRRWTFDDGAWSEYRLYLRRGGDWYEVKYGITEERTTLPDAVRLYLDTLRWDGGRSGRSSGP